MNRLRMTSTTERPKFLGVHWVIYPSMWPYKVHIMLMLLIMVYLIIFFPLDLAFNLDNSNPALGNLDMAITIYFGLDILVSFFTSYEQDGVMVTSNQKIAMNYLMKWFIIDLVTVIPLDLIFEFDNFRYKRLLKVPRLMRLVNSIFQNTESKKKTRNLVIEKLKFSSSKALDAFSKLLYALIFIHVTACIWALLPNLEEGPSWIEKLKDAKNDDSDYPAGRIYLISAYYMVTTIASVGFGDITPASDAERIFAIFLIICGVYIYTTSISMVGGILTDRVSLIRGQQHQVLAEIKRHKKLPFKLMTQILDNIERVLILYLRSLE